MQTGRGRLQDSLQVNDAEPHQIPVVMHKANLEPWLVIVPLDRLEEFVTEVDTLLSKDIPEGSTGSSE